MVNLNATLDQWMVPDQMNYPPLKSNLRWFYTKEKGIFIGDKGLVKKAEKTRSFIFKKMQEKLSSLKDEVDSEHIERLKKLQRKVNAQHEMYKQEHCGFYRFFFGGREEKAFKSLIICLVAQVNDLKEKQRYLRNQLVYVENAQEMALHQNPTLGINNDS